MVDSGDTFEKIWQAHPGYAMVHKSQIEAARAWWAVKREADSKKGIGDVQIPDDATLSTKVIASWIHDNCMNGRRPFRTPQLYIWGPTRMGKTSLVNQLRECVNTYDIPPYEDFYDFWEDDIYGLAVFDEFEGQKTIQWMNQWLDGSRVTLRKKGSQVRKLHNVPTIILSNLSPMEAYHHKGEELLNTFLGRIEIVHVTSFIDVKIVASE